MVLMKKNYMAKKSKTRELENIVTTKNPGKNQHRILIFTPTTGLVRMEWVKARHGQVIPTNWSNVEMQHPISSYIPIDYQLADAQNLMAKYVVENDFEWVLSIEHDNVLPPDAFVRLNEYMIDGKIPVVSGLYFTKSNPPEPILYRGRGNGHFADWKMGDKVWVDGVPFGLTLIHASLIKLAWKVSPEYRVGDIVTRRVFDNSPAYYFDPDQGLMISKKGTTDLCWCDRLIKEKILEKAGFPDIQKMKNPFLVDTNIYVRHIDNSGNVYPDTVGGVPGKFLGGENYKGKEIK